MQYRRLGRTGLEVSAVGFGAWAIGGTWGPVNETDALAALHAAADAGITFFDTADVYGDGRSERLIGQLLRERSGENLVIATKAGLRLKPHVAEGYTRENLTAFVERSLKNLGVDAIDLLQLHVPPNAVYYQPEVFEILDGLVVAGKIRHYGASVRTVEEGLKAIEYPAVATVQVNFSVFRQRPAELLFPEANKRGVGVIARIPLASGLLTGKITLGTQFAPDDHRCFNRHGEAFDRGETFSGVGLEAGLEAVERLRRLVPVGATMAQFALRWILAHDAVSVAIPGARNPGQAAQNAAAADLPALSASTMAAVEATYLDLIRDLVHQRW
jgi:aryl-alcohol dehydrogenase-like predicted oxidoreductase